MVLPAREPVDPFGPALQAQVPPPVQPKPKGGFQGVPVPEVAQGDPEVSDAVKAAILKLLQGEGFSNIDASRNLIRQDAKTGFRDAAIRRTEDFGARGLFGSGQQVRDVENLERTFANASIRGLNDLETANEQLGLQKTAQGIQGFGVQRGLELTESQQAVARALGINDQQLRDLISRRQAGAARAATQAQLTISDNQLALQKLLGLEEIGLRRDDLALRDRLGSGQLELGQEELALRRLLGLEDVGLRRDDLNLRDRLGTGQLDLQRLLGDADIRQGDERNEIARLLGLGNIDLGQQGQDLSREQFEFDRSLQEFIQSFFLNSQPGFGPGASAGNPLGLPPEVLQAMRDDLRGRIGPDTPALGLG